MVEKETTIELDFKNYNKIEKKKNDWWVWLFAMIFIVIGLGASITFLILLCQSYNNNGAPLAAYSGAIVSGITLCLGGLTQMLVFIHRKQDEEAKRLDKSEHDYTNFFIKNYHWNEMISLVLSNINRQLNLSLTFDRNNKCVKIKYDPSIGTFNDLRKKYISLLSFALMDNKLFLGMLSDEYNFDIDTSKNNTNDLVFCSFSSFDTELKKSAMTVEKILQAKTNLKYEESFYNFNMKDRIKKYASTIIPYFIILIHDNKNYNFAVKAIELLPFIMYYLSEEE